MAQSKVKLDEVMTVDDLYDLYDLMQLALAEEENRIKYILDAINIIDVITTDIYRKRVEIGEITYKLLLEEDTDAKF